MTTSLGKIMRSMLVFAALFQTFSLLCSGQTVADVARQERLRQKNLQSKVVIRDIKTATPDPDAAAPDAPSANSPAGGENPTPATAPAKPAAQAGSTKPKEPVDREGHDEKYWRAAFQKARDDAKRAGERAQLLDVELKTLNTQLLRQSDLYNRENVLGPQITAAERALADAQKESVQAQQKIADLEDQLRKAGGLPGWAR